MKRLPFLICVLLIVLLSFNFSCDTKIDQQNNLQDSPDKLAKSITIYRDTFGVPHIFGPTDASVVFGFAYARCEDEFYKIESFYATAVGRNAEIKGEDAIVSDYIVRAKEIELRSREEYADLDPEIRALCQAYTDGINYFLTKNPVTTPRLFSQFEPWFILAGERYFWEVYLMGLAKLSPKEIPSFSISKEEKTAKLERNAVQTPGKEPVLPSWACNSAAIGPKKTKSGNAMLLLNQHQPLDADYEVHLVSEEGWNYCGISFYGYGIMPFIGFNSHLGWTVTENQIDGADGYKEIFDNPDNPLAYRFGDGYRTAKEWTGIIKVKTDEGLEEREVTYRRTHRGPVFFHEEEKILSVRTVQVSGGALLSQLYGMNKARNLEEFQNALSINAIPLANIVYADDQGNIYYLYNAIIPKRNPDFDWVKPVDGSDPETDWKGFHTVDELPQVLNPESGFVQNCNSIPFATTTTDNPLEPDFPPYMVVNESDHPRSKAMREYLAEKETFSFDDWAEFPFDSNVGEAEEKIPLIMAEWNKLKKSDPDRAEILKEAVDVLSSWNQYISTDSMAATLFHFWIIETYYRKKEDVPKEGREMFELEGVMAKLEKDFGTWRMPYGEVFRHQRRDIRIDEPFSDERESLPVSWGPGAFGLISAYYFALREGTKRYYGRSGHSYVAVVEFGEHPKAQSIIAFGQSMYPESPHYQDQTPLYIQGKLKPVWLTMKEIEQNQERTYHPGE